MPGGRLLLVDDDRDFLEITSRILQEEGYDVVAANGPEEGLRKAASGGWDLVILDVVMPGMDGYQLCERLKAQEPTFSTPVLFLTAKKEAGDMLRGFFSGAHDYAVKPVSRRDLVAKVAALAG